MILMIDLPSQNRSRDLKGESQNKSVQKTIDENIHISDVIMSMLTKLE